MTVTITLSSAVARTTGYVKIDGLFLFKALYFCDSCSAISVTSATRTKRTPNTFTKFIPIPFVNYAAGATVRRKSADGLQDNIRRNTNHS